MTGTAPRGDVRPPTIHADEKTTLLAFLDYLRESITAKLAGLSDEQARTPGVPSGTSLLWLIKHLTAVEHDWVMWAYRGETGPRRERQVRITADDTVAQAVAAYREMAQRTTEIALACDDLHRPGVRSLREHGPAPSLRWVLVHLVEETARHAGHADILREQIDGAVGR
ncbi:DinB family protein [Thermobifida fusca]|jgi:uncharacterized damage-inducible protein DinB|uniref:DinB family protein n=2 Tax=Nocardiopsidaceae TaxID=83676 RepID=UPI00077C0F2D|nr:DinB family protein [Thermobifida fusca]PZN60228.1 MAG: DinB family protein [Thermobifida fusca]